jgi:hypothetical protein
MAAMVAKPLPCRGKDRLTEADASRHSSFTTGSANRDWMHAADDTAMTL